MTSLMRILTVAGVILTLTSTYQPAFAGVYTDDLTKCVIESTSPEDRESFIKWMYFAISNHPTIKSFSSLPENQIENSHKAVADIIMKLLTESCKAKAAKAIKYEGQASLENAFQVFGQIAGQEIFANPDVAGTMSHFEKYLDSEKLKKAFE